MKPTNKPHPRATVFGYRAYLLGTDATVLREWYYSDGYWQEIKTADPR
jgi:hypothetical protein